MGTPEEKLKRKAAQRAEANGHSLGEWQPDTGGYLRAWCQNRNCYGLIWVKPATKELGGTATFQDCTIRKYRHA